MSDAERYKRALEEIREIDPMGDGDTEALADALNEIDLIAHRALLTTAFASPRWLATIWYRSDRGRVKEEYRLNEIEDLQEYVEQGPHWDTIIRIEVERINHTDDPNLTVEMAEEL